MYTSTVGYDLYSREGDVHIHCRILPREGDVHIHCRILLGYKVAPVSPLCIQVRIALSIQYNYSIASIIAVSDS